MIKLAQTISWIMLLLSVYGCDESSNIDHKKHYVEAVRENVSSLDSTISTRDSIPSEKRNDDVQLKKAHNLQRYFHPNMSHCGGALYGIYSDNQLIRIESRYGAELGYSSKHVDFKNNEVVKITYREHFAEWDKYSEKYPDHDGFDPKRMTYSDTLYVLEFGKERSCKKYAGEKLVSKSLDEELSVRLLKCVETMKSELASEKELVVD